MAAVDNKHMLQILAINKQEGVSKKTGLPFSISKAQCVITGPEGQVQVGELNLPKSMTDVVPGKYLAEFELGINFDRLVIPVLTKLHTFGASDKPAPKA